uniref:Uncharacterized protein n=1 Tax=Lepeophtheirus salmonis TaxID=72036 RepID=A0A0K2TQC0_LEPSM
MLENEIPITNISKGDDLKRLVLHTILGRSNNSVRNLTVNQILEV